MLSFAFISFFLYTLESVKKNNWLLSIAKSLRILPLTGSFSPQLRQCFAPTRAKTCLLKAKKTRVKNWIITVLFLICRRLAWENPFTLHLFALRDYPTKTYMDEGLSLALHPPFTTFHLHNFSSSFLLLKEHQFALAGAGYCLHWGKILPSLGQNFDG